MTFRLERLDAFVSMMNSTDADNLITLAIAAFLGAILGLEREIAAKPAGLRTHIFVAAGSALMMIIGQEIIKEFPGNQGRDVNSDPVRVLQAIVVGISFLGAGTIVQDGKDRVQGLTTAATIFLTSGLGVAVSIGRVTLAVYITAAAFALLLCGGLIERRLDRWRTRRDMAAVSEPTSNPGQAAARASSV